VKRVVSVFSKETNGLVAEYDLSSFDLTDFKQHFGVAHADVDSEMVTEHSVGPVDVGFLSAHLSEDVRFDFNKYTYFLSCYRAE